MTKSSLSWQKKHLKRSKKVLKYDLRGAAEQSKKLGRPLTRAEFESFKISDNISKTPIKRLVYDGSKLTVV